VADAAYIILTRNSRDCTGNFFIDVDLLRETGVTNFKRYQNNPEIDERQLLPDLFL
jgi:citronellol/citronellal dehydrogenase